MSINRLLTGMGASVPFNEAGVQKNKDDVVKQSAMQKESQFIDSAHHNSFPAPFLFAVVSLLPASGVFFCLS